VSDEPAQAAAGGTAAPRGPRRKRRMAVRLRSAFRARIDRVLGADLGWSILFAGVVVLLLGGGRWSGAPEPTRVGQVADRDLRARQSFEYPDESRTEELRQQARQSVLDVYAYDPGRAALLADKLSDLFAEGRELAERHPPGDPAIARALDGRVGEVAYAVLEARRFDAALERTLVAALRQALTSRIVGNKALLEQAPAITLVADGQAEELREFSSFTDLEQARERLRSTLAERLELPAAEERALAELALTYLDANVAYDHEATEQARSQAASAIGPRYSRVEQGQLLVRKGERINAEQQSRLLHSRGSAPELGLLQLLGLVVPASMLAFFLHRYTRYHQRAFRKLTHLHALIVLMTLSMLLLSRALLWLAWKVADDLEPPFDHLGSYPYLIPLGAGAILVALLANGRIATVYAAFVALLFGAAARWDAYLTLWAMLVQCAGVYAISTYRERSAVLRAGLVVGGAGALAAVALETLRAPGGVTAEVAYTGVLAFVGGAIGVGLVISFSLPLLESLFRALTDIRLLELSNVNNPLLSELALKAPGSYNHSLVVGTLAEEGAKAIGANSLFCRVAAFYHDIGKMRKPEYFVENQRGVNPHDRLSPSMSALVIAAHVKEGIQLAREAGLPEQIIDIIPQHHGTKLMTFFYEKARSQADPDLGPVREQDFRYPGPKPQTREAAIFMLADAVEAAARTVEEPSAHRLREMILKVTNAIVVQGELDSCDLTFSDLEKIQRAFLRCLVSMYHHRIDYPGFDFSRRAEGKPRVPSAAEGAAVVDQPIAGGS